MGFLRQAMTSDRGAILAIGAAGLGAILLVGALVVDLGSARVDRAQNQVVTDAAAAAGIIGLVDSGGVGGCEAALGYVEAHVGPVAGLSCSGFPVDCDAMTLSTSTLGTSGGVDRDDYPPSGRQRSDDVRRKYECGDPRLKRSRWRSL